MKTRILIFFFVFLAQALYAQEEPTAKCVYKYSSVEFLDENGKSVDFIEKAEGIVLFAEIETQNYIALTIGDKSVFDATITKSKRENFDEKSYADIYLCVQEFQGVLVPLQFFVIFDKTKSTFVPESIVVQLMNKDTGKITQTQSYTGISRTK